jgi:hypothetical protein
MIDIIRPVSNGWLAFSAVNQDPRNLVERTSAFAVAGDGVDPNTGEVPLYSAEYRGVLPEKLHIVANWMTLPHNHQVDPRPTGGYGDGSFIYPVQSLGPARRPTGQLSSFLQNLIGGPTNAGTVWGIRRTRGDLDFRHFGYIGDSAITYPKGVNGAMIQTTDPLNPQKVFIAGDGGPLISDYRSSRPDEFSSLWFDVDPDDVLARYRKARTSTGFEVRRWSEFCPNPRSTGVRTGLLGLSQPAQFIQTPPADGGVGPDDPPVQPPPDTDGWDYAIALQGSNTPKGIGGFLFATFDPADAHLSHEAFGPLREASSKHFIGYGDQDIHSGALSTMALFYDGVDVGKASRDGPLPFEDDWLDPPRYDIPIPCELVWNPDYRYQAKCGPVKGRWEIQGYIPVAEPPPCEDTKEEQKGTTNDGNPYIERTYTGPPVLTFGPTGTSGNRGYPQAKHWGTP